MRHAIDPTMLDALESYARTKMSTGRAGHIVAAQMLDLILDLRAARAENDRLRAELVRARDIGDDMAASLGLMGCITGRSFGQEPQEAWDRTRRP